MLYEAIVVKLSRTLQKNSIEISPYANFPWRNPMEISMDFSNREEICATESTSKKF
jgi:hypothetical protein